MFYWFSLSGSKILVMKMPAQVLSGITILDLGRVLSAPYCGAILAEFGAQVIKIEKPGEGDETRDYSPKKNGESGYYITFNRGKKGITLDFKRGKKLFLNMIKNVDVVIENFRPGVMKRLGLDYNELKKVNSRLIYAAISGFGQTGPYASRAGYDTMAQAMSGLMSITGPVNGPPTRVGASVADVVAGLQAAIAILAALRYRDQTGKGQMIDIALVDSAVVCMAKHIQEFFTNNEIERHRDTRYGLTVPESLLKTNDGYIVLCGVPQTKWNELCELANKQALRDDYRFSSAEMRFRYQEQMDQLLEEWTIKLKTDDLIEILINNDFAAAPVL